MTQPQAESTTKSTMTNTSIYNPDIHKEINDKLDLYFDNDNNNINIPNLLFYGGSGSGKRTIVNRFIHKIYNNDNELIKNFVMYINCAHGKGIKFIREELKFFAKSHINLNNYDGALKNNNTNTNVNSNTNNRFKLIVLSNADKLTIDAQSALRRCIEIFSNTTRFFIIIENKDKLLKPIISRLSLIYIPYVETKNKKINLHKDGITKTYDLSSYNENNNLYLKRELNKQKMLFNETDHSHKIPFLLNFSKKLYEKGISLNNIITYIEKNDIFYDEQYNFNENELYKYKVLILFNKIKKEIRNEEIMIFFILKFIFLRSTLDLENILIM